MELYRKESYIVLIPLGTELKRPIKTFTMLKFAGYLNLLISLLHFIALFDLARAFALTGVTEQMARAAAFYPALPFLMTFVVAIAFALFGIYALAAAGVVGWKLPFMKNVLYAISGIYIGRGIGGILRPLPDDTPGFLQLAFSLTALGIGLLYLIGTRAAVRQKRF